MRVLLAASTLIFVSGIASGKNLSELPGYSSQLQKYRERIRQNADLKMRCHNTLAQFGVFKATHYEMTMGEVKLKPQSEIPEVALIEVYKQLFLTQGEASLDWLKKMSPEMRDIHLTLHEISKAPEFIADQLAHLTQKVDEHFFETHPEVYERFSKAEIHAGSWRVKNSEDWNRSVVHILTEILFSHGFHPASYLDSLHETELQRYISEGVIGFEILEPGSLREPFRHSVSVHPTHLVVLAEYFKLRRPHENFSEWYRKFVNPDFKGRPFSGQNSASVYADSQEAEDREYYKMFYIKFIELSDFGTIDGAH